MIEAPLFEATKPLEVCPEVTDMTAIGYFSSKVRKIERRRLAMRQQRL